MKVLHFYKTYLPDTIGGGETVINQIAKGTQLLGVSTEVLSLSQNIDHKTLEIDGHLVHRCQTTFEVASTPFSISAFSRFKELAKQADIIHYYFPYPFTDILHFVTQANKPTVVTYLSDIIKQENLLKLYRPVKRHFLESVDHIVATSPNYLESSPILSRFADKTSIIPIGLNKNSYPKPSNEILNFWKEKFGSRFFLFIGVLRYYKGLHTLIEAAKNTDYPIIIVGSGLMESELKQQVKDTGVHNIYFAGQLDEVDKQALLELCCALIFPSHLRSESFGVSLIEGAMYGKPLVSCEIGTGTTYINIDKETGVVIPPNDSAALQQAMDYLWNNPIEASAMGQRAEARYWELFTAKEMAASYMELYKKLLNENS